MSMFLFAFFVSFMSYALGGFRLWLLGLGIIFLVASCNAEALRPQDDPNLKMFKTGINVHKPLSASKRARLALQPVDAAYPWVYRHTTEKARIGAPHDQ